MSDPIEQPALKTVPTTLLRKRRQLNKEHVAKALLKKQQDKVKKVGKAKAPFKRAEYFVNEGYRTEMNDKRISRLRYKLVKIPDSVKILFVMRIANIPGPMPQKVRKILQALRLHEMNNAVFLKMSDNVIEKIKIIEPYITWGYPSLKSVHDLIFKYGYGDVNGTVTALSSNVIIEETFSKQGLLCLQDVVSQVFETGPHFDKVIKFIHPFKLTPPKGGFRRVSVNFSQNGSWGNRAEKINTLIRKML